MMRAVFSDLGKVILWFDNDIFITKLSAYCGLSEARIKEAAHWNMDLITSFDKGHIAPRGFYERIIGAVGARISDKDFFAIYNDIFRLNPTVQDILYRIKKAGFMLLLISNTDIERFGFIQRTYPEIMIFDDYVLSYDVGAVKPDPKIYREALKRAGCRPEEAVFIDDLPQNVEAAVQLGMKGIRYLPDGPLEAELKALGLSF